MLLHLAGPDLQEIFTTLPDTGEATDYTRAVEALNAYFVPQVELSVRPTDVPSDHAKTR